MPLPALYVVLLSLFLPLQQAAFGAAVTEVPQLNTGVGANSGVSAGSLTGGLNAPLIAPQPGQLSLTGSVLPAVAAPQAVVPQGKLQPVSAAKPVLGPAAVLEPETPAKPALTVKEQLDGASRQAGDITQTLESQAAAQSSEKTGTQAGALFDATKKPAGESGVQAVDAPAGTVDVFSANLSQPYKVLASKVIDSLKKPSGTALKAKAAYQRGSASEIGRLQTSYKNALLAKAKEAVQARGLSEREVITHGTTLQGLLGMIFSDRIEATSSYRGFSGETAAVWGAYGLDVGASYGATRGVSKGQPGVTVIVYNPQDPIKVVQGETMSRSPSVSKDFYAAVVSDGERTLLLDQAALRSLARSAREWKDLAVNQAHRGSLREFSEWERMQNFFDPDRR